MIELAILTSPNQWFESYVEELSEKLGGAPIFRDHSEIKSGVRVLFILSYHRVVDPDLLSHVEHSVVIHESALPKGKGWAPLFWQVLEGRNAITFSMIKAESSVDSGPIYMQRELKLTGCELNQEIRSKQAALTIDMCLEFVSNMARYIPPTPQLGEESYYPKRTPADSQLDINKTISEQFNLLLIVNNDEYPAYFDFNGRRYKVLIDDYSG